MELLALQDLRDVEIEEVAVKDGLNASRHDSDDVVESLKIKCMKFDDTKLSLAKYIYRFDRSGAL